ncbi:hypothetical protein ACRWWP_26320, partial [Escherichia coli]
MNSFVCLPSNTAQFLTQHILWVQENHNVLKWSPLFMSVTLFIKLPKTNTIKAPARYRGEV